MVSLTIEEDKSYKQRVCYICKKEFSTDDSTDDKKMLFQA